MLEGNDKKDIEIEIFKNQIKDLNEEEARYKKKFDEIKKDYELFVKNSKNADQLKIMQNKINNLNEEKLMLQQTQTTMISEMNTEITDLKESLKKKDLELSSLKDNDKKVFLKTETNSDLKPEEMKAESKDVKKEEKLVNPEGKEVIKSEVKQDEKGNNAETSKETPKGTLPKMTLGFFGRMIAPIFLTDKEIENMNK